MQGHAKNCQSPNMAITSLRPGFLRIDRQIPTTLQLFLNFSSQLFSQYLVQSNCSTTKMNTRSQAARPPSQPALPTETFEELMEISLVPHENQDLHCRVSLLESQFSQLFNENVAFRGSAMRLLLGLSSWRTQWKITQHRPTQRWFLPPANARSDDLMHYPKLSQFLEKNLRSQPLPIGNVLLMLTLHPCPLTTLSQFPHPIPQTLPHPSPILTNPIPLATQIPLHQTAHGGMYKENGVREVWLKNLLPIHRLKIQGPEGPVLNCQRTP